MGVFEKLKNALFEEEYIEVEEKPKKLKKEKVKSRDIVKEKKEKEEKPIAKKVVLPEKKAVRIEELEEEELLDEDFEIKPTHPVEKEEKHSNFKVMEDRDFQVEGTRYNEPEPKIVKVIEKEDDYISDMDNEYNYYSSKKEKQPYGIDDSMKVSINDYGSGGAYERKEERTYFKPSPIISPIYGILDKNYKKEDVVSKREVRITSSYARENLSVDDVRNKAYGTLSDDIAREVENGTQSVSSVSFEVQENNDNLLVDLSDNEKPSVKEVTMGDALEYFQDLGLEYNVDYVDAGKEKATGRRVKENYDDKVVEEEKKVPVKMEKESIKEDISLGKTEYEVNIDSDDNLFDLIDSMYQEND